MSILEEPTTQDPKAGLAKPYERFVDNPEIDFARNNPALARDTRKLFLDKASILGVITQEEREAYERDSSDDRVFGSLDRLLKALKITIGNIGIDWSRPDTIEQRIKEYYGDSPPWKK